MTAHNLPEQGINVPTTLVAEDYIARIMMDMTYNYVAMNHLLQQL